MNSAYDLNMQKEMNAPLIIPVCITDTMIMVTRVTKGMMSSDSSVSVCDI